MSFLLSSYILCLSPPPPPRLFLTPHPSNRAQTPPSTTTPAPPPGLDNSNYIPLKYYRWQSYSTVVGLPCFHGHKNSTASLEYPCACVRYFIIVFRWVPALSFRNERKRLLPPRFSLCARCHTRWQSIIEWFCEGSMRLGIVFIPLSLWISGPFISALRNSTYSTLS